MSAESKTSQVIELDGWEVHEVGHFPMRTWSKLLAAVLREAEVILLWHFD